jgi:uncharacterized protein (DUF2252 family)
VEGLGSARASDGVARITALAVAPRAELHERGRAERHEVHRRDHAEWIAPSDRRSPLDILAESNATRVPELVPIRYGRMVANPFAYFRGAPAVMAADLARTPQTRIWPQLCGDAHLSNFGVFGTPERSMIFDLNDFDETLPGPFEWDLKRLTASFVVAARTYGFGNDAGRDAARDAVLGYAYRIKQLSALPTLDIWYAKTADTDVLALAKGQGLRRRLEKDFAKARRRDSMQAVAKLTRVVDGRPVIVNDPPLIVHDPTTTDEATVHHFWREYHAGLRGDRRHLADQYEIVDVARKVVGVGSVGTRCYVALLAGRGTDDLLMLQVKESQASVLEPYLGRSEFDHHGERVVTGQRLLQAASDIFLGWVTSVLGNDYFVRQLRDMKFSTDVATLPGSGFFQYASLCGSTLARAHANTCDPAYLSGYVGRGGALGDALVEFADGYATQSERDHTELVSAVRDGVVEAVFEARP